MRNSNPSTKASRWLLCAGVVARWTPWSNSEAVMAEIAKSSSTWSATWVSKSSCLRSRAIKTLESITIPMVT